MRNGVKSEKSQRRESILDLHSSVFDNNSNNEILLLLESILQRSKQGTQTNCTVRGLRTVQEHLMHGYGYLHLEEAYNLYSLFSKFSCPNKQNFKDKLLDPHHGLPVYKESSARLFGLVMKEKCFFCFSYDML